MAAFENGLSRTKTDREVGYRWLAAEKVRNWWLWVGTVQNELVYGQIWTLTFKKCLSTGSGSFMIPGTRDCAERRQEKVVEDADEETGKNDGDSSE